LLFWLQIEEIPCRVPASREFSLRRLVWSDCVRRLACCRFHEAIPINLPETPEPQKDQLVVHRPLASVPENTPKLSVGIILSAFGTFWTGEGLGIDWPGTYLAIPAFAFAFLILAFGAIALLHGRAAPLKASS
jgi:hypothetical protein